VKKKTEYVEGQQALENFDKAMDALMKVPHSEIKAKLEEEKKAKIKAKKGRNNGD
jgi:hypothetical protein